MKSLKKIRLNEAPNLSGFKGFGGKGVQAGGAAQQQSITKAAANGSVKNFTLSPSVNFCKSVLVKHPKTQQDVEMLEAFVSNIRYNEERKVCNALNNFIQTNTGTKMIVACVIDKPSNNNNKQQNAQQLQQQPQPQNDIREGYIMLKINPEYLNDIMLKWGDEIGNFFTNNGYNGSKFGKQLARKISECPTQADIKVMNDKIGVNFMDLLKNINNLDIKNKMFKWQVHNYWLRDYNWGWVLSRANAMLVLGQRPDATFVTTENGWRKYNRTIKPGAMPIYVYVPDFKSSSKSSFCSAPQWAKEKAAQRIIGPGGIHYKTWNDAVASAKGNEQSLHHLEILAQQIAGISDKHLEKMYDITDTIPPKDPQNDVWANKKGLVNNLFGELNPHAEAEALSGQYPEVVKKLGLDKKQQQQQQQQQQDANNQAQQIDDATQRFFDETLASRILIKWGDYGTLPAGLTAIQVYKDKNNKFQVKYDKNAPLNILERDILKVAQEYALKKAPTYGIIKADKQKRVVLAVVFALSRVAGYDFNQTGLNRFSVSGIDPKESHAAWSIFSELLPSTSTIKNENKINFLNMGKKIFFEDHEIGVEGQMMSLDEFLRKTEEIFGPRMDALKSECGIFENKLKKEKKSIKEDFVNFYNRLIK